MYLECPHLSHYHQRQSRAFDGPLCGPRVASRVCLPRHRRGKSTVLSFERSLQEPSLDQIHQNFSPSPGHQCQSFSVLWIPASVLSLSTGFVGQFYQDLVSTDQGECVNSFPSATHTVALLLWNVGLCDRSTRNYPTGVLMSVHHFILFSSLP